MTGTPLAAPAGHTMTQPTIDPKDDRRESLGAWLLLGTYAGMLIGALVGLLVIGFVPPAIFGAVAGGVLGFGAGFLASRRWEGRVVRVRVALWLRILEVAIASAVVLIAGTLLMVKPSTRTVTSYFVLAVGIQGIVKGGSRLRDAIGAVSDSD